MCAYTFDLDGVATVFVNSTNFNEEDLINKIVEDNESWFSGWDFDEIPSLIHINVDLSLETEGLEDEEYTNAMEEFLLSIVAYINEEINTISA